MASKVKIKGLDLKIVIACFVMATVAWGAVFYGHSVYLESFTRFGTWTTQQIASAILIFWISSLPGTLFVGYLIDSKGPSSVVLLGGICIGLGLIGLGQADKLWKIFICYGLMGFAYPAIGAAGISAILAQCFSKNFGFALGLALTGASLGGAVIPVCTLLFIGVYGFKTTTFVLGLLVSVILFCLALFFKYQSLQGSSKRILKFKNKSFSLDILRTSLFWKITIAAALGLGGQVGFLAHQIPIIAGKVDELSAALTVSVVAISAAIGRILIAVASRSISVNRLAAASYFVQGVGVASISFAETFPMVIIACSITGFVVGGIVMLPPILIRNAFGSVSYGKNYAMTNVILYTFAGVSPWLVGLAYASTNSYVFGLLGIAFSQIIAALLIFKSTN
ncbi:MAG: hypothetical protein CMM39_05340 [Rhodospirillaceae bacterium]|nr:hypothetical protein [Rhodospirillaceae bacterium]